MINYKEIIEANPAGVLATQNGDKVATRYVSCLFVQDNKVYFWTDAEKPMAQQMIANPNISFCTSPKNYNPVLSVQGKVVFVEDRELKTQIWEGSQLCKSLYETSENPHFTVFYIDVEEVEVYIPGTGTSHYKIS